MAGIPPTLDYISPQPVPPRHLTMEDVDGGVRVVFPVLPTWTYILPIVIGLFVAIGNIAAGIVVGRMMWQLLKTGMRNHTPEDMAAMGRFAKVVLLPMGLSALGWGLVAAYEWRQYRHWGRVPRVLTITHQGIALSWLGWWRMRERRWPANDIQNLEFKPVKGNLNWTRTVADLRFCRHKGRTLRFRLSAPDSKLPSHIAQRLAEILHRPLTTK